MLSGNSSLNVIFITVALQSLSATQTLNAQLSNALNFQIL